MADPHPDLGKAVRPRGRHAVLCLSDGGRGLLHLWALPEGAGQGLLFGERLEAKGLRGGQLQKGPRREAQQVLELVVQVLDQPIPFHQPLPCLQHLHPSLEPRHLESVAGSHGCPPVGSHGLGSCHLGGRRLPLEPGDEEAAIELDHSHGDLVPGPPEHCPGNLHISPGRLVSRADTEQLGDGLR